MDSRQNNAIIRSESPLFEPENDVITKPFISTRQEPAPTPTSKFIRQLQCINDKANAAIAAFSSVEPTVGSKRKAFEIDSNNGDDDDDSDEDDNDIILPFDPDSEKRPRLPMYHPGFKLAENIAQQTLSVFDDFLEDARKNKSTDSESEYLRSQLEEVKIIQYEGLVRIAVTGDTGSGKSATVNSILGEDGLTPEGDSGCACTNVITEFLQAPETQQMPISVLIVLYCAEKCEALVVGWFKDWFNISQMLKQEEETVDDNDTARKDASFECLKDLFAHHMAPVELEEFLASATSAEDRTVLRQLKEWTAATRTQFIDSNEEYLELTSTTHPDMREQLRPFRGRAQDATFRGKRLGFSPWPLVSIIRYRLNKPILKEGNCIADVPGAGDVNYHRVQIASEYLQSSRVIIVVGEIKRLTSDSAFRQHYLDAHRRKHNGSVILVATKSDDINDDSATTIQLGPSQEERLECIEQELADTKHQIGQVDNEIQQSRRDKNKKLMKALKDRRKPLMLRHNGLEKERRGLRIACRNREVAQTMEQKYRSDTGDDNGARSFCISNRMYMRHLRGYDKGSPEKIPTMSIAETQIPDLRAHIFAIPSEGKTGVLQCYITSRMRTFLTILRLSCSSTTKSRVEDLIQVVCRAKLEMNRRIKSVMEKFVQMHIKPLIEAISDQELQLKFDMGAAAKLKEWYSLPAATHQAVVRKKGLYVQKKKKLHLNWNADLLKAVSYDINESFKPVINEACRSFKAELAQSLKGCIHDLNRALKEDPKALAGDEYNRCFSKDLKRYERVITIQVDEAAKKLRVALANVNQKCIKTGVEDYILQATLKTYEDALEQKPSKGKTLRDARHTYLIDNLVGPSGPFPAFAEWVEEDTNNIIDEMRTDVCMETGRIFTQIQGAFEAQKNKPENDTEEGKKFRAELHRMVDEAQKILDGSARLSLEACMQYK